MSGLRLTALTRDWSIDASTVCGRCGQVLQSSRIAHSAPSLSVRQGQPQADVEQSLRSEVERCKSQVNLLQQEGVTQQMALKQVEDKHHAQVKKYKSRVHDLQQKLDENEKEKESLQQEVNRHSQQVKEWQEHTKTFDLLSSQVASFSGLVEAFCAKVPTLSNLSDVEEYINVFIAAAQEPLNAVPSINDRGNDKNNERQT